MADDFKERLERLELNFDEYLAMFYRWLDELRTDMKQHEARMDAMQEIHVLLAENDGKIIETQRKQSDMQGYILKLIDKMDGKLDNHEGRLSPAGI